MALVDLTNVDPYGADVDSQKRVLDAQNQAFQGVFDTITNGIQAGQARRTNLEEKNRAIRDREYSLANAATDELVQANTNNKYTDVQLQEVGQQFKQEFYDAVKVYEESDKGDEARRAFETTKQKTLGSARVIGASIDKLGEQMEMFKEQAKNGGISDSMNPAIRSFFNDLNDPATSSDAFQIVTDPDTGQLKYQGVTSDGHPVDFFLDDLANGENDFTPVPKADMPKVINNLMKDVKNITKQEKRDTGVVEIRDWDAMGTAIGSRVDSLIEDQGNFRSIAAGLGYSYEDLKAIENGEEILDDQGKPITNIDDLKKSMKTELMMQIESTMPEQKAKWLVGADPTTEVAQYKKEQEEKLIVQNAQQLSTTTDFNSYVNKKATIKGQEVVIHSINNVKGKVTVNGVKGKNGVKQVFDTSKPDELALLQATLTGKDYNKIRSTLETASYNNLAIE